MKKVLSFLFWSLIFSLIFAIPLMLLMFCLHAQFNIYIFLYSLIFGPAIMSFSVILLFFNKNTKLCDKGIGNKIIKRNEYYKSKPVVITAICIFAFSVLIFLYGAINTISEYFLVHYYNRNQYDKVITISKILIKLYPKDCKIYSHLTYANFQKQNYDEVIDYNKQCLKCNPDYYISHIDIARAIYLKNENNLYMYYKDIIAELDKSLAINKDSYTAYWGKQDINFQIKDCEKGIKDIENILNIIDKKGAEESVYKNNDYEIRESLPKDWRKKVLENLSTCPNSKEKETLIKKLQTKI